MKKVIFAALAAIVSVTSVSAGEYIYGRHNNGATNHEVYPHWVTPAEKAWLDSSAGNYLWIEDGRRQDSDIFRYCNFGEFGIPTNSCVVKFWEIQPYLLADQAGTLPSKYYRERLPRQWLNEQ